MCFIHQIVFVGTVVMVGLELLRVTPIAFAAIRRHLGPRLTEKEKKSSFFIFRPLSDPSEFPHADLLAQVVLYFTVQLVYAVIAPITSFVLAFCFLYMGAAYRHQMVYIYPTHPDSGGKLWTRFIGILITCMLIAEVTGTLDWMGEPAKHAIVESSLTLVLHVPQQSLAFCFSKSPS
jgi:calcium permeable stress-gated cation channel